MHRKIDRIVEQYRHKREEDKKCKNGIKDGLCSRAKSAIDNVDPDVPFMKKGIRTPQHHETTTQHIAEVIRPRRWRREKVPQSNIIGDGKYEQ